MAPGTINRPNPKALKVHREKVRTKKKLSAAKEKHVTQLALLKTRNPKRVRKLAKRKAALERAAASQECIDAMEEVKSSKSKKAQRRSVSGGENKMQE